MFQSDLVRETSLSRSRTSEILTSFEKRSLISRFQMGKNYRIILNSEAQKKNYAGRKRRLRLGFTRSAEYPFIIPFRNRLRDDLGIEVGLQIYENGLDVARDLSIARLDLGITPILSGFMFCSLGAPFKFLAPAGAGGSCIVSSQRSSSSKSDQRVATTKLSTMELLLKSSVNKHFLPDETKVVYTSNPHEMVSGLVSGRFDAACIWEPYATLLAKRRGFSKIVTYNELEEHICCALSAGNHLNDQSLGKIASRFGDSIEEFSRNPYSCLAKYSRVIGFDSKIMNEVSSEYSYPCELEPKLIVRQFEHAGIQTPSPSTVKEMIRPTE